MPGAPVRVLYIDDDPALRRLVERALVRHGFSVAVAGSGDEGLARLRDEPFDAVALDHFMPGREGIEVLQEIRALDPFLPVIYVTGADEGRLAVAALKAGADDYVIKDVGGLFLELLRKAVEQAIEGRRLRRQKEVAEREMREARERAEMLLREVNHRVANSLALVASLVSMQANGLRDQAARDALIETQNRIAAIAGIHRRLYTSEDVRFVEMASYLRSLVDELETAMRAEGRAHPVLLDAAPVRIPTDKAVSVGVIVTELVTNAYKYAYPDGTGGDIRVGFREEPGGFVLCVEDDGVGLADSAPSGSGLGSRIVKAMAVNLDAVVMTDPDHAGTRISLAFPGPAGREPAGAPALDETTAG
ncbi:MAG TPA: response regulator [Beijerinckiaceae bacterium]|nr:response regulator [Beijerinckiaceae bacterium]